MSGKTARSGRSTRPDKRRPYARNFILKVVREVEDGVSRKEICGRYGMAYVTLCEWMVKFGSEAYQAQRRRIFTPQQRRTIVRGVLEGRTTKQEACLAHNLDKKVLSTWMRNFSRQDEAAVTNEQVMLPTNTTAFGNGPDELAEAKLKIKALETLIDLAEQEFKIAIRKKPGVPNSS